MDFISESALVDRFDDVKKSDFDVTKFRLSSTGRCQRMRMLKVLGYESEDITDETAEIFERGNVLEDWFVEQIINKFPRKTRKQVEVNTPFGDTGHMDIWFPNPKDKPPTIIEVKSVHENARHYLPKDDNISQVQAYMHFFTDSKGKRRAERAELIYIFFGRKLETMTFEIKYNPFRGKAIEKELKKLHEWKKQGHVPNITESYAPDQFPCFWTTKDGNVGTCPYYRHCWANEPQTDEYEDIPVYDDDTMTSLMEDYLDVSHEYSILQSEVKQYKQKKKELEKVLSKNLDFRDTDIVLVGNTRLKRTKVKGRTYLKPERAYKQGLISEQAYQKIREVSYKSSGYERFYTKQINRRKKDE